MADLKTIYTKSPGNYSSTNWRTVIADTTGTGNLVFADSPALTGTPTASEPSDASNTTDIATTNFVALKAAGITPIDVFNYTSVSGTTQLLNLNDGNFFDGGTLTDDTTVAFTNIPAGVSKWTYTFDTGWDVTDADNVLYAGISQSVGNQDTNPYGVHFKPDGTRMYIVGDTNNRVYQYDLAVPWDTTIGVTYPSSFYNVGTQDGGPDKVFFKPDGTRMYVLGKNTESVYQYNLTVPWDITATINYDTSTSVSQAVTPQGLFFKPDGTRMYVIGDNDVIYQYNLSTSWDVTTGVTYDSSFSVSSQDGSVDGLFFKPDGTRMFVSGSGNNRIYQYDLSVPWDVTTGVTYDSFYGIGGQDGACEDIFFKPDGTRMFMVGSSNDRIYQYDLFSYTISLPASVRNFEYDSIKPGRNTLEFYTTDGGTNIYVNHTVF